MTTLFDRDIQLTVCQSPEQELADFGQVSDNFLVNGVPNGGYLMAMMANAALSHSERQAPVSMTANFLRRSVPGEMAFKHELMNRSGQFDRLEIKALQKNKDGDEKEAIRAFVTLMDEFPGDGELRYERPEPEVLPRDECQRMLPFPNYSIFRNVISLMEPSSFGWMKDEPSERSEHKGWIRLADERPWDALSLILASDAFPPPVLASQGMVAWVPTIELSVQLRKIPISRWLKCVFRSNYITDGLVEEDGEIWDEEGHLVAISRQLAQFKRGHVSKTQKISMRAASAVMAVDNWRRK